MLLLIRNYSGFDFAFSDVKAKESQDQDIMRIVKSKGLSFSIPKARDAQRSHFSHIHHIQLLSNHQVIFNHQQHVTGKWMADNKVLKIYKKDQQSKYITIGNIKKTKTGYQGFVRESTMSSVNRYSLVSDYFEDEYARSMSKTYWVNISPDQKNMFFATIAYYPERYIYLIQNQLAKINQDFHHRIDSSTLGENYGS